MTFFIAVLLAPFVLVTSVFLLEVAIGLAPMAQKVRNATTPYSAVIVVPAHDEAKTIELTLASLREPSLGIADILVIADNCVDETAAIARRVGVHVVERNEPGRRGKGFALARAQVELQSQRPDVVVVIDADCSIDRASLAALVARVGDSGRPGQTINLLKPGRALPSMVQVSNFAFMLKNLVRQRGLQRLAGSVHLTGTGMALPWAIFAEAPLATADIVEDIKLGLELTKAGTPPVLVEEAIVWSDPSGADGTLKQRERWEGGFLRLARAVGPPTILEGLKRGNAGLLVRGLDMLVPPLTLLMALDLAALALAAALTLGLGAAWWPVWVQLTAVLSATILILLVWAIHGRRFLSAKALATLPFYLLWKIPMYLRLRRGRADDWLRAGR